MMAQPKPSVDSKSDLSVVGSAYSVDFFPGAYHPLVDDMLDVFPPISLLQELKSAAQFDDIFRKAFPNPPCEVSEKVKWLQGYICRTQHVSEIGKLKSNSDEAIYHLKLLYSAFSSDSDDRLFIIDETSEIVLENADIILCTTHHLLYVYLYKVDDGMKQLKEAVSQEIMDLRKELDKLQIQYSKAKKEYKDLYKACLEGLKALNADLKRHLKYLIDSAVKNDEENAPQKSNGFRAFKQKRRDKKSELDELNGQVSALKDKLKAIEEQADQGDNDTQDAALIKLLINLEIMDLHLVYAFYFLTQLEKHALSLDATCRKFCSIALGYKIISENDWLKFKYDILASNIGWVAIDRLFDEFATNKHAD